jgi:hypothetical protein
MATQSRAMMMTMMRVIVTPIIMHSPLVTVFTITIRTVSFGPPD